MWPNRFSLDAIADSEFYKYQQEFFRGLVQDVSDTTYIYAQLFSYTGMKLPYIVFEGVVGSGKTTQSKLLADFLKEKFPDRVLWTREPGSGEIPEAIRKVVQGTIYDEIMDPITETYLYAASRAQTLRKIVKPFFDMKGIVVSDRSYLSTLAFQGYGRGLGLKTVLDINKTAVDDLLPGLVLYIKVPPEVGASRAKDQKGDKFESQPIEFHHRVEKGYDDLSRMPFLKDRFVIINGNSSIDEVFVDVKRETLNFLKEIKYK